MKIEDIDFEPHRGVAVFSIGFSLVYTLVFGTIVLVNLYRQLRAPTLSTDFFGWLFTFLVTFACVAFMLHFTTVVYRIRFYEAGIVIIGLGGRRFIPWSTVRDARIHHFKGNLELILRADGRRLPISVPLNSYKKQSMLLAELRRRLPVPINDAGNLTARLTDN
ncbi:MAG TPA: hypothetical protein VEY11_00435 [Pyrinomonadaceae bacterium]|nr:hypothetical protein [Pyrinomonadaceae bacterium]